MRLLDIPLPEGVTYALNKNELMFSTFSLHSRNVGKPVLASLPSGDLVSCDGALVLRHGTDQALCTKDGFLPAEFEVAVNPVIPIDEAWAANSLVGGIKWHDYLRAGACLSIAGVLMAKQKECEAAGCNAVIRLIRRDFTTLPADETDSTGKLTKIGTSCFMQVALLGVIE